MILVLAAFFVSLAVASALTPIVLQRALANGVVDQPTTRRVHTRPIPRVGGIAIVLAFFVPVVGLVVFDARVRGLFVHNPILFGSLAVGGLVVAAIGLRDDLVNLGAKRKLFFQIIGACVAYAGGLRIEGISWPPLGTLQFGVLALPVTVFWIVGMINALNFIDGLDGLAGGIAFFACITNFVVAWVSGRSLICFAYAALAGSILGFLIYNFNPAKIFMGDCGSMFLGFVLACMSLVGSGTQKSPTVIAILVPLLAMGVPVMDMLFAVGRRFMARRSIFAPDRGHIHHRLLDVGLTQRRAVLILYGLSLLLTLFALSLYLGRSWQIGMTLAMLSGVFVCGMRFLAKFSAGAANATQRFHDELTTKLRRAVPMVLPSMDQARTLADLPRILQRFAYEHGLLAVAVEPVTAGQIEGWQWESPCLDAKNAREIPQVRFSIATPAGQEIIIRFFVDTPDARVLPQTEILLQLIVDAAESLLRRTTMPPVGELLAPRLSIPPLRAVGGDWGTGE